MNPVILIPTYVSGGRKVNSTDILDTYDHMTPLSNQGELPRCLISLRDMGIDVPIAILVVAESGHEQQARAKVIDVAEHFPTMRISVIAVSEEQALHARMAQLGIGSFTEGVSLAGYGPMRNLGLIYALSMGYTEAVFIDDDEIIDDPEFIEKACYGLGMMTQNNIPILIKSGFFLDKKGNYHSNLDTKWYNKYWNMQRQGFNDWIDAAMGSSRLSISNTVCGGCMSIHREAMKRVSFDPWITRGEDLDYLLNVRMYGSEIWFDNEWHLIHRPPKKGDEIVRFSQDMHRWLFERRKLEYLRSQIDLLQVDAESLEPYPGIMLGAKGEKILRKTANRRALGCSGLRKDYYRIGHKDFKAAKEYAANACMNYFPFQHQWPELAAILEEDIALKGIFENSLVNAPAPKVEPEPQAFAEDAEQPADAPVAVEPQPQAPSLADEAVQRELADFDLDFESLGIDGIGE